MSSTDYSSDTLNGMTPDPVGARRVVVLISGSGSNLQALIDAQQHDLCEKRRMPSPYKSIEAFNF